MSPPDPKPKSRYDELPMMQTPSGRLVYDPNRAAEVPTDTSKLGEMLREMAAIENADARDEVPEPREADAAPDGALVAAGEDAVKAHAEAIVAPHIVPSMPSAPVRIREALDPRKTKTQRIAPVAVEETPPSSAPPSMSTPASGAGSRDRRWVAVPIGAALLAVLVAVMLRGSSGPQTGASDNDVGAPSVTASAPTVPNASASATSSASEAASASATSSATAPSSATAATSVAPVPSIAPSVATSASVKVAPKATVSPKIDAGATPEPTATLEPVPSVAPTATVTPSAAPTIAVTVPAVPSGAASATTSSPKHWLPKE
jgi:hypothetical protein